MKTIEQITKEIYRDHQQIAIELKTKEKEFGRDLTEDEILDIIANIHSLSMDGFISPSETKVILKRQLNRMREELA